jgi:exopolysaccharide production protein ExoQ
MSTISINAIGTHSQAELGSQAQRGTLVSAAAVLIIVSTFINPISESWKRSTYENFDVAQDDMEVSAHEGDFTRQIVIVSLGIFGLLTICWPGGNGLRVSGIVGVLCLAYLAWCAATYMWSDDPSLSLKRLIVLMCQLLAALGIAKRCSPQQFVWIVFYCTLAWLGLGVAAELSLGTFHPWKQGYRFAGVFHPNQMGINCAILTLAALYLAADALWLRGRLLAFAAIGFSFLSLSGSRTALASAVAMMAAQWILMAPRGRLRLRFVLASVAAIFAGLVLMLSMDDMSSVVAMGREKESLSSFTGRVPLWEELVQDYASERPLTGFGFGAFWSPNHIYDISESQTWAVASSHSTYVDLLLNVGLIGGILFLGATAFATIRLARLEIQQPRTGYGFMAILVIYVLCAGLMETTVSLGWFLSFFAMGGICFLMVDESEDSPRELRTPDRNLPEKFATISS